MERVFLQRVALAKSNVSLSNTVSQQKAKIKKLEQEKYVDAKASRTTSLEKKTAAQTCHRTGAAQTCQCTALREPCL